MKREPGEVVAGRFRLVRPLSEGAMGCVWLATHLGLDVPCAVKFMHPHLFELPELKLRFEREAKAAAAVRSAHIVQMLDYGVSGDTPYIAMELLEGEDLAARLARKGKLSPLETIGILSQVGRALSKAHAKGLVHRDLKPENIFLCADEVRETVKVVDFGVVRVDEAVANDRSTRQGTMIGTPAYMSPEQAMGLASIDARSDLWSLAVVAFECLTGTMPFQAETVLGIAMQVISGEIPVPSRIAEVPPGFDAWFAKSVSRDRETRFATAQTQLETLALALGLPRSSLAPPSPRVSKRPVLAPAAVEPPAPRSEEPSFAEVALATARTITGGPDRKAKRGVMAVAVCVALAAAAAFAFVRKAPPMAHAAEPPRAPESHVAAAALPEPAPAPSAAPSAAPEPSASATPASSPGIAPSEHLARAPKAPAKRTRKPFQFSPKASTPTVTAAPKAEPTHAPASSGGRFTPPTLR